MPVGETQHLQGLNLRVSALLILPGSGLRLLLLRILELLVYFGFGSLQFFLSCQLILIWVHNLLGHHVKTHPLIRAMEGCDHLRVAERIRLTIILLLFLFFFLIDIINLLPKSATPLVFAVGL